MGDEHDGNENLERVIAALQSAVIDVLSRMAMTEVVCVHRDKLQSFCIDREAGGMVRLSGLQEGMIGISSDLKVLRDVVARIIGLDPGQLTREDLMDGIAELANMIGGGMKSNAGLSGVKVSTPMAVVGNDLLVEWKTDRPTERLVFQADEGVLYILVNM